jgi:hypothetical protein
MNTKDKNHDVFPNSLLFYLLCSLLFTMFLIPFATSCTHVTDFFSRLDRYI